jgi:hypothetical protein
VQFSGDNGGETSEGVTAETVRVAFRVLDEKGFMQTLAELAGAELLDSPETVRNTAAALAEYFNQRFQFYGRSIDVQFYDGVGSTTRELLGLDVEKAVADATRVAEELNAFADISAASAPYGDALADRRVVAMGMPWLSREWHVERHPFAWSLNTDCTILAEQIAGFTVARLQGEADFAGPGLAGKPRRIAGITPENPWYKQCVRHYQARVDELSGGSIQTDWFSYRLDLGQLSTQAKNIIPQLAKGEYTSVIFGGDPIMPVFLSGEANSQHYYPEFIPLGVALIDRDFVGQLLDPNFAANMFGISSLGDSTEEPASSTIAYEAFKSVRPDEEPAFSVDLIYYQMYMLAIGIQMAGPNLTPDTFAQGMFDYPATAGPAGLWDFGPGDYTAANDAREIYWDPGGTSLYNGRPGRWVNPTPGARYPNGEFPSGPLRIPR